MDTSALRYPLTLAPRQLITEFKVEKWRKIVSIVRATPEDLEIVAKFFVEVQLHQMPFSKNLTLNYESHKKIYEGVVKDEVDSGLALLAVVDNNIIGFETSTKESVRPGEQGVDFIRDDYAELAEELYPGRPADLQAFLATLHDVEKFAKNHIPLGPYFRISKIAVQKEFGGQGIGKALWTEALKLAKAEGFEWASAECAAVNSTKIAHKLGMPTVFTLPFDKIIFNGQRPYPTKLDDGLTGLNLTVGKFTV